MTGFVAALPMYDWPEVQAETDAEWARFREAFHAAGIDAPQELVRRNADLPPVPGGIRHASGEVIAPDPATLPPEELHFPSLWLHPKLLFAQTCWGPMELGLEKHVRVIGQPSYDGFEGGQGGYYSSAIVMRRDGLPPSDEAPPSGLPAISPSGGEISSYAVSISSSTSKIRRGADDNVISPLEGEMAGRPEGGVPPPADGRPLIPLDLIRGKRLGYNSDDSMSGIIALTRDLAAMGENLGIFSERIETGGHRASIVAVAEGRADVCAIDCRSWDLAKRFEPAAHHVQVVGWTGRRKGLPYIASLTAPVIPLPI